jgi:hypothetical protein
MPVGFELGRQLVVGVEGGVSSGNTNEEERLECPM